MAEINVDEAIAKLTKNFAMLSEREMAAGISAAINRSLVTGRVSGEKQIKKIYAFQKSEFDKSFKINKATSKYQFGEIKASTSAISLIHFQPKFSFTPKSKTSYSKTGVGVTRLLKNKSKSYGQGVSVEIIKGQRKVIPFAFMIAGKMPIFARGAYEKGGEYSFIQRHKRIRKSGADWPISSLVNISIYSSLVNDRVMPTVSAIIEAKFGDRLAHELDYRMSKMQP